MTSISSRTRPTLFIVSATTTRRTRDRWRAVTSSVEGLGSTVDYMVSLTPYSSKDSHNINTPPPPPHSSYFVNIISMGVGVADILNVTVKRTTGVTFN